MALAFAEVQLIKDDLTFSSNKAIDYNPVTGTDKTSIGGGPSDLWTLTLTEAEVEHADFGVRITMIAAATDFVNDYELDAVRMKVYYTAAAAGGIVPLLSKRQNTLLRM